MTTNTLSQVPRELASNWVYKVHAWRGRSPEFMQTQVSRLEAVIREAMQKAFEEAVKAVEVKRFEQAMDLLNRAANYCSDCPPDKEWFRDLYVLTGEHMVLTEEGWQPGDQRPMLIAEYGEDYIYDEVNGPLR